jgi:hypothetical protein
MSAFVQGRPRPAGAAGSNAADRKSGCGPSATSGDVRFSGAIGGQADIRRIRPKRHGLRIHGLDQEVRADLVQYSTRA